MNHLSEYFDLISVGEGLSLVLPYQHLLAIQEMLPASGSQVLFVPVESEQRVGDPDSKYICSGRRRRSDQSVDAGLDLRCDCSEGDS